jgi:hypothetical protein
VRFPSFTPWKKERFPKWLLNSLLVVIILFQLGILFVIQNPNALRNSIQVEIKEATEKLNMELELGELRFSPWSRISCQDLELKSTLAPYSTLALVDMVRIEIAPFTILTGKPQLKKVELKGVTIVCPALYSPTGSEEPVLDDMSCSFVQIDRKLSLQDLTFRLHNLTVSCSLKDAPPLQFPKRKSQPEEKPILQTLNETLAKLYKLKPNLSQLESPTLHLTARKDGTIHAELTAQSLQLPEIFQCGHIRIFTELKPNLEEIQFTEPFIAKLDNILFRKQFRATQVHLNYAFPEHSQTPFSIFPIEAKVSTTEIFYEGEPTGRFIGGLRLENLNNLELQGTVGLKNSYLDLHSSIQLDQKSAIVDSHINLHQSDLHHLMAFIPRKYLESVQFRNPIEGELNANLSPGWKPEKAVFSLRTGQLVAADVPIEKLHAKGTYVPGFLDLDDFTIHLKPGNVSGSLKQNLNNLDYRLMLNGEFFPSQINPWMQDWWIDLWDRFTFTGMPVQGNFSLEGRWNDLSRRDIFGEANIFSASYKGVPFSKVSGKLRGIPKFTELTDLNAQLKTGNAKGSISWVFHPTARDQLTSQRFSLQGQLLPQTAGRLFGKEVQEAVKDFDISAPASVESSGVIYGKKPPAHIGNAAQDTFAVSCKAGELAYHKIPLKNLDIFLHAKGNNITINPLKFEFANGKAEGWIKHRNMASDDKPLEISMKVLDANKNETFASLSKSPNFYGKIHPPDKESSSAATIETFEVHAKGHPEDISSFEGKGTFDLFDPELAKVNMLSLLSNELTGLTLPLISYRFNRMTTDFELKDRKLVIEKKPLLISGPAAKVEATGDVHLKTEELQFKVKLHPLGLPLANILEMRLGGKLNDPKWNPSSSNSAPKNKGTPKTN